MSVLLAACGAPAPTPSPDPTPTPSPHETPTPVPTPIGPSEPPGPSSSLDSVRIADDPPALALDEVARVDQPVNIAATADGWLFVNERRGRIIAMDPASGMTRVAGWYLFSDYCSGRLFGIRSDAPIPAAGERAPAPRILLQTGANVSAFGEGADGELYLADIGSGVIYRIVAGS